MPGHMRPSGIVVALAVVASACSGSNEAPSPLAASGLQSIQVGFSGTASSPLSVGQTAQLFALGTYSDNTKGDLSTVALWRTTDPQVAAVSATGVVTAVASGSATISAVVGSKQGTLHIDLTSTCGYILTPSHLVISALGNGASVTVTASSSDCRWTAKSDVDWFTFTFDPGVSGTRSFSYSLPGNNTTAPRSGHIVVTGTDGATASTGFDQEVPLCSYVAVPDHAQIPLSGGTAQFLVNATPDSCAWTLSAGGGITVNSPVASALSVGDAIVTYTLVPNVATPAIIRINPSPTTSPAGTFTITH